MNMVDKAPPGAEPTADHRLLAVHPAGVALIGAVCHDCGTRWFPSSGVCPACASEAIGVEELPREGTIYSLSTVHVGPKRWKPPFTVGYVDLPNGVRVFAHLRGEVRIGSSVVVGAAVIGTEEDGSAIESFVFAAKEA